MGFIVLKFNLIHANTFVHGKHGNFFFGDIFFIFLIMNFAQTLQTDFGILQRLHKRNKLTDGRIELTDNVLHGYHHAQRHLALNHRISSEETDEYIFGFVDENSTQLLVLIQS